MKQKKKYCLLSLCLIFCSGWLQAVTTIRLAVCEGGTVILEIPDCEGNNNCCITWLNADTNETLATATQSCTFTPLPVFEDIQRKAIVTKDNLGETEEFIFIVTVIDPDRGNFAAEPKDCCYEKGQPLTLDDFSISYEDPSPFGGPAADFGTPVFTPVGVEPNVVMIFNDQQQGISNHIVSFVCHQSEKEVEVDIVVVDSSIEIEDPNAFLDFSTSINVTKAVIKLASKFPLVGKAVNIIPRPNISIGLAKQTTLFKSCCIGDNCTIHDSSKIRISPSIGIGTSTPEFTINPGTVASAALEAVTSSLTLPLPFSEPAEIEVTAGFTVNLIIPEFIRSTGCTTVPKSCIGAAFNIHVFVAFTAQSPEESFFARILSGTKEYAIDWTQGARVCYPPFSFEVDDLSCPEFSGQKQVNLMFSLASFDVGEKSNVKNLCDFYPD